MKNIKKWFLAARLRTLPLSLSGIVLGGFLSGFPKPIIFILCVLTAVCLQVLSNFANDYGDGVKGSDDYKIGEQRAVASGEISSSAMKNAMILFAVLSFGLALLTVVWAFQDNFQALLTWLGIGILAILAAIFYTVGKNAYGYLGLGDVFVFLFFGIVAVFGTFYLQTQRIDFPVFLMAAAIGAFSTAVLNLNNLRDRITDKAAGKNSVIVKFGEKFGKIYQTILLVLPFVLAACYLFLEGIYNICSSVFLIFLVPIFIHLKKIKGVKNPVEYDPELKKIGLITFGFSLVFGAGLFVC